MRNKVFQTPKKWDGLPVCACVYTCIHVYTCTYAYTCAQCPLSKKFKISCYIINFNQMSAFSSNDQITKFYKMYKMDHCHSTSEM